MDIHPIKKKTMHFFKIVIYKRLIIQQFYSSKIHGFYHVLHPHINWILTGYGIWFIYFTDGSSQQWSANEWSALISYDPTGIIEIFSD